MKFYTKLLVHIIHNIIYKYILTNIYFADVSTFKMKSDVIYVKFIINWQQKLINDVKTTRYNFLNGFIVFFGSFYYLCQNFSMNE
jgi:hypothetical protein